MLDDIGTSIREARRGMKMRQAELAENAGVSVSLLSLLESGRIEEIGFNRLLRIMHVVGLDFKTTGLNRRGPSLDDLMERQEEEERSDAFGMGGR
jgi:transcriptional regulator with XRE-family HTH domain